MVQSELSRGQEETVPSQLFGPNEERALGLENSEYRATYPMSASHALLQNTENGPVPQKGALQSQGVDATALILSNSQPTDV